MTDLSTIGSMMKHAGQWACLVGPQAAGKTVFADYLRQYAPGQEHAWSMVPTMRAATGNLAVRTVSEVARLGLLGGKALPLDAGHVGHRFPRGAGTKDIVQLQASVGRDVAHQLSVPFFDVPGEWAATYTTRPRDPLHVLLERTRLFVVFVSYWGLLPPKWLTANAPNVLRDEIYGTSMAGNVSAAVDAMQLHANSWLQCILDLGAKDMDILVVLSQFQESTAIPLLDSFSDGLGTRTWQAYQDLLTIAPPRQVTLDDLARHISLTEKLGHDLLSHIESRSRELGFWSDVSFASELGRLRSDADNKMAWQRKGRAKVRSWSILPLNVLNIRSADRLAWYDHGVGDGLEDFRMCEDVLWWLILHLKAHELWQA